MNPFKKFDKILCRYITDKSIKELPLRWKEKHRYYHTVTHLIQILKDIENNIWFSELNIYEKHALLLAAFFHDIIYNPKKQDNEEQSIKYFLSSFKLNHPIIQKMVCDLIETTKYRKRPTNRLEKIFWDADNKCLKDGYENQIKIGKLIRKEYSHISNKTFNEGRVKFFENNLGLFGPTIDKDFHKLIKYYKKS